MKREADYFAGTEPELIFVAKRLSDAVDLESVLTGAGVDYAVEADEYQGGTIFRSMRVGAFFMYVPRRARRPSHCCWKRDMSRRSDRRQLLGAAGAGAGATGIDACTLLRPLR